MHRQSTSSSEHSSGSSHYQKAIHYETTTTSGKDGGNNLSRSNSSGRLATSMMSALTTAIGISVNTSTPPIIAASTPPPEIMQSPSIFGPVHGQVQSDAVWHYFTLRGWLTKHVPPSYSFTKSSKLRYLILADRMLYVFKNDQPTLQYREFFELTKDTQVFVSDRFTGVLYCLVISKRDGLDQKNWYLECADAETMKEWLDKLKKTVAWLKENDNNTSTVITLSKLSNIQSEHDALVNNHKHESSCLQVEPLSPRWLREGGKRQESSLTTSSYFDDSCSSEEYLSGAPSPTSSTMKTQLSPMTPPMYDSMRLSQYNQYPYSPMTTCYNSNYGDSNESLVDEHHPIRTFSTSPPFAGSRSLSALPPQRPPPRRPVPPPPSSSSPMHHVDYASSPQHFMYP